MAADGPCRTALAAVPDPAAAVALCARLRTGPLAPRAIELMSGDHARAACRAAGATELAALVAADYLVLVESGTDGPGLEDVLGAAAEAGEVSDALVAQNEAQRRLFWRLREEWAIDRERPGALWYDVSVPLAELPAYLEGVAAGLAAHDPALDLVVIGHLADGNLHVTVNAAWPITERYEEIAPLVTDVLPGLGGSFSAEHGVGLEKRTTLVRLGDPGRLATMRRIKATLDPHGILNPGKGIPEAAGGTGRAGGG